MSNVGLEVLIILLLILLNGVLAMAEIAVVSSRKARLQQQAEDGDARAQAALDLANNPSRFLSTVQIGITLVGILAGAFGGATLAGHLAAWFARSSILAPYAEAIGVGLVVLSITYLSLLLGELAPKQIGIQYAERIAVRMAPAMHALAMVARPVVYVLTRSTDAVLRVLGVKMQSEAPVTDEEIKILIQQGTQVGVFEPIEEEIVDQLFRLSDRIVAALVTPRTDIVWFDLHDSPEVIRQKISASGHSRFPVADGDLDNVRGIVVVKDLIAQVMAGQPMQIESVIQPALFVPERTPALTLLERFRETRTKIALVIDEFGGLVGLVTVNDIIEAILGELPEPDEVEEPEAVQREDGSWLVDGMFALDEFQEMFDLDELPEEIGDYYHTVGGFVMAILGRVPATGDHFEWQNLRIEVVDMDGRRVDKVLVMASGT